MDFSETILVCDIKVGRCSQLNEYMNMNINGQDHSLTLVHGHSRFNISNFFASKKKKKKKNTRPIEAKFHIEPPWDIGMKMCSYVPGHTSKMAFRPISGKNFQNSPSSEPRVR